MWLVRVFRAIMLLLAGLPGVIACATCWITTTQEKEWVRQAATFSVTSMQEPRQCSANVRAWGGSINRVVDAVSETVVFDTLRIVRLILKVHMTESKNTPAA